MINLNQRIIITLQTTQQSTPTSLKYGVWIDNDANIIPQPLSTHKPDYIGIVYVPANTSSVDIDVTDIVRDNAYKGDNIRGFYSNTGTQKINNVPAEWVVAYVHHSIYQTDGWHYYSPQVVLFAKDDTLNIPVIPATDVVYNPEPHLIPHIPYLLTTNFMYRCMFGVKTNSITITNEGLTPYYIFHPSGQGYAMLSVSLKNLFNSGVTGSMILHNKRVISYIDQCPSDYYICWIYNGQWYSWGFDGKVYKTEDYKRTTITNIYDQTHVSSTQTQKSWELNSDYVDESTFNALKTILKSSWVGLYDTKSDKFYWVNPTNSDWTDKQSTKKLYTLNLIVEDQTIEYD